MTAAPHPRLAPWTETLFPAWEALNRDPRVAHWLGGAMSAAQSRATFERVASGLVDDGWGILRDEHRDFDHPGLSQDHPLRPHVMYCLPRVQEGPDR
jgi:hypothetical protein